MVGTGRGAQKGILIRDIDALQKAERIDTVVLDKTGTVTRGRPVVREVVALNGMAGDEVLALAAAAEQFSEHPLAQAIVRHAKARGVSFPDPESFNSEPGFGVVADVAGQTIIVGGEALLEKHGVPRSTGFQPVPHSAETLTADKSDGTVHGLKTRATAARSFVHVAARRNGSMENLGYITIADEIKDDSAAAIAELHRMKLRTVLLTGDNRAAAAEIAKLVGIDDVRAEVKPDQKARAISDLQGNAGGIPSRVAMVGDGINDAPALAQADLGIAIGSGSDIAKETGDIVLVSGSLHGIAAAIRLSRATMRTIRQNLFLAFIYNVLAIPLAAFGILNPLIAAAAMALSDVSVIGNALLLRRTKID
jgi:Cu+-exporting ATPase